MYKILVIEDDIHELDNMCFFLSMEGFEPIKATTGKEGIRKVKVEIPDLVTIDIGLPDMAGLDIIPLIRPRYKGPIIMVTALNTTMNAVTAIKNGADDFIEKPWKPDLFLEKINKYLNERKTDLLKSAFKTGEMSVDFAERSISIRNQSIELSRKELEFMKLMTANAGKIVSFDMILQEIWGEAYISNHDKARVLISGIRKKISEISTKHEYFRTIHGIGFRFEIFPFI